MLDYEDRVQYALSLLSSLEEIREENIVCDFSIKAGKEEFPVYRAVLSASSKYFRALLQSGMIEARQGFINLEDMGAITAKIVVTYMYTGAAELSDELIENVLGAAHLLQLDGLVSMCWRYLQNNISVDNCVLIVQLSRLYDRCDVEVDAERYLVENLGQISSTESFSTVSKDDIIRYMVSSSEGYKVLWQVMVSWVSRRHENHSNVMIALMSAMKSKDFPFQFLFEKIETEDLVSQNQSVKNRLLEEMFSKEEAKSNLSHENVFTLKQMVLESNITRKDEVMEDISCYISKNFEDLFEKEEFAHLNEDDMLTILHSAETECSSEELKWKALLKWGKHDRSRKKSFTKFFKLLKLERLSNEFIRDEIREEPIVKSSTECLQMIVDASFGKKKDEVLSVEIAAKTPGIAILDWKKFPPVTIRLFDVDNSSLSVPSRSYSGEGIDKDNCAIINNGGVIYILINGNFFKLDQESKWIELPSLPRKAGEWPKMASLDGDIYVLARMPNMTRYQPLEKEWTTNMPECGIEFGFCFLSLGNCLYALGGRRGVNYTNEVKRYDPKSQDWTNMQPMLERRSGASAAVLHSSIVVAGGYDGRKCLDSVECFTHLSRSWSKLTNTNSCHTSFTLLNICDKLYACGGDFENGQGFKEEGTIEVYDEEDGKWRTLAVYDFVSGFSYACEVPV